MSSLHPPPTQDKASLGRLAKGLGKGGGRVQGGGTGQGEVGEGGPHGSIWGVCMCVARIQHFRPDLTHGPAWGGGNLGHSDLCQSFHPIGVAGAYRSGWGKYPLTPK